MAAQIRKVSSDFRECAKRAGGARSPALWSNRPGFGRFGHTYRASLTGNGYCLSQGKVRTYRSRQYAHLMLDLLIERVSYDPMAVFIAVAVVLLIMLARTL